MSGCTCDTRGDLRVTGEVWENPGNDRRVVGSGSKCVRVRCSQCGGKVARVGSDLLTRVFGFDESEIRTGRCLDEDERRSLEVDLL